MLPSMVDMWKLGTGTWLAQFIYGFPITGFRNRSGIQHTTNEPIGELDGAYRLFHTSNSLFANRGNRQNTPRRQFATGEPMGGAPTGSVIFAPHA